LIDELPDLKIRRDFENDTIHLISKLGGKIINDPIKIRTPHILLVQKFSKEEENRF